MSTSTKVLCRYRYNALDLLTAIQRDGQLTQRLYAGDYLVTAYRGKDDSQSVFQQGNHLLALQSHKGDNVKSQLLTTDQQRSVLRLTDSEGTVRQVYTAYGHRQVEGGPGSLPGFNGEAFDQVTGHYLLGNGHRAFNPVLMRFNSPDGLSPFGRGGLNSYAYCLGDPVNFGDPTGRFAEIARLITSVFNTVNARIVMGPAIPYKVAKSALQWGAAGQLPLKMTAGAAGSVVAGVSTMLAAITGVASAVATINKDTEAGKGLAFIALGLGAVTLAGRFGSRWAARDPKTIPTLKSFSENRGRLVTNTPTGAAPPKPSAPPLTPEDFPASAPPPTPPVTSDGGRGIERTFREIYSPAGLTPHHSSLQPTLSANRIRRTTL